MENLLIFFLRAFSLILTIVLAIKVLYSVKKRTELIVTIHFTIVDIIKYALILTSFYSWFI